MIGFIVSLILVLIFSGGAGLAGTIDGQLAQTLQQRFGPETRAEVQIKADPFFQLPFGNVPEVDATIFGMRAGTLPISRIEAQVRNLHVDTHAAMAHQIKLLLAPAEASYAVTLTAANLQSVLDQSAAAGQMRFSGRPFFAGNVTLSRPVLTMTAGRLSISGEADVEGRPIRMPFVISFALAVRDGHALIARDPALSVNGHPLPQMLLNAAADGINPVFDLDAHPLGMPLRLTTVQVGPAGLVLNARGEITNPS